MNDLITNEERLTITSRRLNELLEVEENFNSKLEKMVKMEKTALEEYNKLLEGNLQLHRMFSVMMMVVVFFLAIGLFVSNL